MTKPSKITKAKAPRTPPTIAMVLLLLFELLLMEGSDVDEALVEDREAVETEEEEVNRVMEAIGPVAGGAESEDTNGDESDVDNRIEDVATLDVEVVDEGSTVVVVGRVVVGIVLVDIVVLIYLYIYINQNQRQVKLQIKIQYIRF